MNVSTNLRAGESVIDNAAAAASEAVARLGAADFLDAARSQAETVGDAAVGVFTGFWNGVAGLLS